MSLIPCPPPAHRTGRAQFAHPALGLASHRGMQTPGPTLGRQTDQSSVAEDLVSWKPTGPPPSELLPANKEMACTCEDETIHPPVRPGNRSIAEVAAPTA